MPHYDIIVKGYVQGVYYRASARAEALRLGLCGFARNEEDGSVRIEAEGEQGALDQLVAWCRRGPPHARVETVEVAPGPWQGLRGFQVRG